MYKLLFFFFLTNILFAQKWQQYSDSILVNYKKNNIKKAELFLKLTEQELSKINVKKDTIYADYLYRKGVLNIANYECITLFEESLNIWQSSQIKNYSKIMKIHYFMGDYYYVKRNDDKALMYFTNCYDIHKKNKLEFNQTLISSINFISRIYYDKNDYVNARKFANEYINLNKESAINDFNFDYVYMYEINDDLKNLEITLIEYLKNYEKRQIYNPSLLLKINFELLRFYYYTKKDKEIYKSISYGEKVLEIYFKYKPDNLEEVRVTNTFLINLYKSVGSTEQENYIKKINEQLFPENYFDYYDYFDKLDYYLSNNDLSNFLFFFNEFEKELKENNDIDNLVKIYGLSLTCFEQNNNVFNKEQIVSQYEYLNTYTSKLKEMDFYDMYLVEYYCFVDINPNKIILISQKHLNNNNIKLRIIFYFFLIVAESEQNIYSTKRFNEILDLINNSFGIFEKEYEDYLIKLIKISELSKTPFIINKINLNLIKKDLRQAREILDYYSTNEILIYTNNNLYKLNYYLSNLKSFNLNFIETCYELNLLYKNLSLRNQQRIKNNILKSSDTVLKQQYEQFITNKRYLTKLEELPLTERPADYDQLKTETEILEKDITRKSSEFAEAKKSLNITWKQIQEKLKPNEVVIDLVAFNYYNKKWTDSIIYGAFVIKKDSKFPKFISLFEEKQLAVLLERNNHAHDSIQSKIINKQYLDRAISDLFYKPLEAELKNGTTIYLAPAGLTHQINFKALPILENQTFGEKFKIKLLGSSASIVDHKATTFSNKQPLEFVLYGGIDYNKRSKEDEENHNKPHDRLNELATRSDISEFKYLKGTNEEVQRIKTEAEKYNFTTTIYKEKNATEESVKQLDGRENPFVLHLATHGYFFENVKQEVSNSDKSISENPKRSIYSVAEDPMMRSGLLLSGANNSWGKTNNETNLDDGILTAKEISNLDLSNCQLVVLSACETGLGDINGSEGVFGLQRAFKMAGVKNIIMSLWKVPDAQTAELFESFYAECFQGKTIHEAFQEAQNKMKAKYPPYFWAGFVLLE